MDPVTICEQISGTVVGYACARCGMFFTLHTFGGGPIASETGIEMATGCCLPKVCEKHGIDIDRGYIACRQCRSDDEAAKESERFAQAKKIALAEYDGTWLFSDGFPNEGYIRADGLADYEHEEDNPILYAWACAEQTVTADDCCLEDHVFENILQEHHESAGDFVDCKKVREAEALLVEACKDVKSYHPVYSVAVVLRPEVAA